MGGKGVRGLKAQMGESAVLAERDARRARLNSGGI